MRVLDAKIAILLATRNGTEFLHQQLESFRAQTHLHWELVASDDGSTDTTRQMLQRFAGNVRQPVVIMSGPQLGFWQNFVHLVRSHACDADLFAFSDQDDVWHAEKLSRAAAWFAERDPAIPALYFTRTELVWRDGSRMGFSPLFKQPPTFRNALVQSIGGGNTMVFNRSARAALLATPPDAEIVSHDWWCYQVITAVGGVAYYDPWPSLRYRQHGRNLVGANIGWRARLMRLAAFGSGRMTAWNDVNLKLLGGMRSALTPDNRETLDLFTAARRAPWPLRPWRVVQARVYRQKVVEQFGLLLGALIGRI